MRAIFPLILFCFLAEGALSSAHEDGALFSTPSWLKPIARVYFISFDYTQLTEGNRQKLDSFFPDEYGAALARHIAAVEEEDAQHLRECQDRGALLKAIAQRFAASHGICTQASEAFTVQMGRMPYKQAVITCILRACAQSHSRGPITPSYFEAPDSLTNTDETSLTALLNTLYHIDEAPLILDSTPYASRVDFLKHYLTSQDLTTTANDLLRQKTPPSLEPILSSLPLSVRVSLLNLSMTPNDLLALLEKLEPLEEERAALCVTFFARTFSITREVTQVFWQVQGKVSLSTLAWLPHLFLETRQRHHKRLLRTAPHMDEEACEKYFNATQKERVTFLKKQSSKKSRAPGAGA